MSLSMRVAFKNLWHCFFLCVFLNFTKCHCALNHILFLFLSTMLLSSTSVLLGVDPNPLFSIGKQVREGKSLFLCKTSGFRTRTHQLRPIPDPFTILSLKLFQISKSKTNTTASVCLSCCNKMPQPGGLTNNRNISHSS